MKKEIADMWIDALRSGKYKQSQRRLRANDNKFCCLGVLCDISGQGEWDGDYYFKTIEGKCHLSLPKHIMNWAEIKEPEASFVKKGDLITLSHLNDSGKTFEEIANIIEKNWKKL